MRVSSFDSAAGGQSSSFTVRYNSNGAIKNNLAAEVGKGSVRSLVYSLMSAH